jgi:hypothetical protein
VRLSLQRLPSLCRASQHAGFRPSRQWECQPQQVAGQFAVIVDGGHGDGKSGCRVGLLEMFKQEATPERWDILLFIPWMDDALSGCDRAKTQYRKKLHVFITGSLIAQLMDQKDLLFQSCPRTVEGNTKNDSSWIGLCTARCYAGSL